MTHHALRLKTDRFHHFRQDRNVRMLFFNIRFNRDHSLYRLVSLLLFDLYRPFTLSNVLIVLKIATLPPFRSIF